MAVGLILVDVFAPQCIDPTEGTWMVRKTKIWVDKEDAALLTKLLNDAGPMSQWPIIR